MKENDFYSQLKEHGLSLGDACEMIYHKTGVYIRASHIRTRFDRYPALSKPMTATFKLFFEGLSHGKV